MELEGKQSLRMKGVVLPYQLEILQAHNVPEDEHSPVRCLELNFWFHNSEIEYTVLVVLYQGMH
jgi:hypothetical protein